MVWTTLQPLAYSVAYISFFVGVTSTVLRFYCRRFVLKTWGWDDYVAVVILMLVILQQVVLHMFLYWGCGLHMKTLSVVQQLEIVKWLFIEEVAYYTVHWVIKSAFLFFYLRLSPNKTFRTLVFVGVVLNGSIWIVNVLLACLQCLPFDEILHPGTHPGAICINKLVLLLVPSVLNILEDFYILILPISTVWNLQMSIRRKIAVLSVIAFGSSSVIIACCRLIPLLELNNNPDTSWVLGKMVIVAALEIQFAVVAVNLPSLKALWIGITNGSSAGSGQTPGSKGYRMSTLERNRKWSKGGKSKGSRGSITLAITSTESEEELFRQGGTSLQLPIQGQHELSAAIKVTTDVKVHSTQENAAPTTDTYFIGRQ